MVVALIITAANIRTFAPIEGNMTKDRPGHVRTDPALPGMQGGETLRRGVDGWFS